jgi:hypothetical protein
MHSRKSCSNYAPDLCNKKTQFFQRSNFVAKVLISAQGKGSASGHHFNMRQFEPFCRMFPHFLMIPLVCYYGLCGIQAVNVRGDSLFNKATLSLCVGKWEAI